MSKIIQFTDVSTSNNPLDQQPHNHSALPLAAVDALSWSSPTEAVLQAASSQSPGELAIEPAQVAVEVALQFLRQTATQQHLTAEDEVCVALKILTFDDGNLKGFVQLFEALKAQGLMEENILLCQQVLKFYEKKYPLMQQERWTLQSYLAQALQFSQQWLESKKIYFKILEQQTRLLGEEHLQTLQTLEYLADLLIAEGDLLSAEALLLQAYHARLAKLTNKQQKPLEIFFNQQLMVRIKYLQGKWYQAETLQEGVVQGLRKQLGSFHPRILESLAQLGQIKASLGNISDAEGLLQQVYQYRRKHLGKSHWDTLCSLEQLASFLITQKRSYEVKRLLEEALTWLQQSRGGIEKSTEGFFSPTPVVAKTHGFYHTFQGLLGRCCLAHENFALAERYLLEALTGLKKQKGLLDSQTQHILSDIIRLYKAWKRPEQLRLYRMQAAQCS